MTSELGPGVVIMQEISRNFMSGDKTQTKDTG